MKVLVTGGCGFIGSHVVEFYARDKRNQIVVLDNFWRAKLLGKGRTHSLNSKFLSQFSNVRIARGDVRRLNDVAAVMKGIDFLVHTAGQVTVTKSVTDPLTDFEVNAIGTFNVLEVARRQKRPPTIVYCSTNKVYGERVNAVPLIEKKMRYEFGGKYRRGIPEDFGLDLCEHSPYGCSKLTGDLYAQDFAHLYGMKIGVFRMSCIYGTRQFGMEDQGWLAWFAIATLRGQPITIYGDGKQMRDVLYVTDLVRAYDAFRRSSLKHAVFNMGGGPTNTMSLRELVQALEELSGKKLPLRFAKPRPSDQKVYVSDTRKAQRLLGFRPAVTPRQGVVRLYHWLREHLDAV